MRTLEEIYRTLKNRITTNFQAASGGEIVDMEFGIESPLALAHAAEIKSLEMLCAEVVEENHPTTAKSEEESSIGTLELYAAAKGVFRRAAQIGKFGRFVNFFVCFGFCRLRK
jgi:hypothetical protein